MNCSLVLWVAIVVYLVSSAIKLWQAWKLWRAGRRFNEGTQAFRDRYFDEADVLKSLDDSDKKE